MRNPPTYETITLLMKRMTIKKSEKSSQVLDRPNRREVKASPRKVRMARPMPMARTSPCSKRKPMDPEMSPTKP